jgi:hypothetical protein
MVGDIFYITGSTPTPVSNIEIGTPVTFEITNSLESNYKFDFHTIENESGVYVDSSVRRHQSGSLSFKNGINLTPTPTNFLSMEVTPEGGEIVYIPNVYVSGSTLYLKAEEL